MRYLKYLSALLIIALMLFQVTAAAYEGNGGSTSYTYDENGKLTDCVIYDEDDGSIYKRLEYQYDEKGYKTDVTTYNISDEVIGHFEYKYTGATEEQYLNDMKNFEEDN